MDDRERLLGQNLAQLRGARSQQAVAEAMRERGWKWSQSTVWSLETGARSLRLLEAHDLADVLRVSIDQLTLPAVEIRARQWIGRANHLLLSARDGVTELCDTIGPELNTLSGRVGEMTADTAEDLGSFLAAIQVLTHSKRELVDAFGLARAPYVDRVQAIADESSDA